MKSKCKNYSKELECCMVLSDFGQLMPVLQPCIESPCKHYKPQTNFNKITESVESLAEWIEKLDTFEFIHFSLNKEKFIEWLKQEIKDGKET